MTGIRSFEFRFTDDVCEAIGLPPDFTAYLYFDDTAARREQVISYLRRAKVVGARVGIDEMTTLQSVHGCVTSIVYFDDKDEVWDDMDEPAYTPGYQWVTYFHAGRESFEDMHNIEIHNGIYRTRLSRRRVD